MSGTIGKKNRCFQCGDKYKRITTHWTQSGGCSHPYLTHHQREIITGLLMGDGYLCTTSASPRIVVGMVVPKYLEYLSEQFGVLGGDVALKMTAKEKAKQNRDSGFSPTAAEENYSDVYVWRTVAHPELQEFIDWYKTGKKVWPRDIELTPTVLKHWFCGDGTLSRNYIRIAMSNEVENTDKVDEMFENVGLPSPSNYNIHERKGNRSGVRCSAQFTVDGTRELFEYMGGPLPDFEYKWLDGFG